jgi:hypothetical protein
VILLTDVTGGSFADVSKLVNVAAVVFL